MNVKTKDTGWLMQAIKDALTSENKNDMYINIIVNHSDLVYEGQEGEAHKFFNPLKSEMMYILDKNLSTFALDKKMENSRNRFM